MESIGRLGISRLSIEEWPLAVPLLQKGVFYGHDQFDFESVERAFLCGDAFCWLVRDERPIAAFVAGIRQFPKKRVVMVMLLGGERFDDWAHLLHQELESLARRSGATHLQMSGRIGWTRKLPKWGWKALTVTMDKEIDHA